MAKVLKCDCSADVDAYVRKNFAARDEVYLTADVIFDAAAKTFWLADGYSGDFLNVHAAGGLQEGVFLTNSGGAVWSTEFDGNDPANSDASVWHTLEIHYLKNVVSEAWVDGTLIGTSVPGITVQINHVTVGQWSVSDPDAAAIAYIDNAKLGTTRGDDDLFSDNFEGGTTGNWDSETGDVSVVDDPFGGGGDVGLDVASVGGVATVSALLLQDGPPNDPNIYRGWIADRGDDLPQVTKTGRV